MSRRRRSPEQAIARAAALGLLYAPRPTRLLSTRPGTMLAIVRGPDTLVRKAATFALLSSGVAFVVDGPAGIGTADWEPGTAARFSS